MRTSAVLCATLLCLGTPEAGHAQGELQHLAPSLASLPDAAAKPAARAATQKAMVKAMQRGRLKAAKFELQKLMYYEAVATHKRRTDLAKRLQDRIREQRATIRSISKAL